MSLKNKAAMRRLFEEAWNEGSAEAAHEILAPDFRGHFLPDGLPQSPEGFVAYVGAYRAAFPDLHMQVEDMLADGDRVAVRITCRGTHTGPLMDIPPTGKEMELGAMVFARFDENGHYAEGWGEHDKVSLLQQLGVMPA
jgi:steroid delta-isomerase-like uncharacterized protein